MAVRGLGEIIVHYSNYSPPCLPLEYITEEEAQDDKGVSPEEENEEQYHKVGL